MGLFAKSSQIIPLIFLEAIYKISFSIKVRPDKESGVFIDLTNSSVFLFQNDISLHGYEIVISKSL
ncbi:MAG: hypothetical protein K0R09_3982 [Clostridiales bacterium]|nr:hypothetical protein [Clostridiales bacterium]